MVARVRTVLCGALLAGALCSIDTLAPARAASFACAEATSPQEKLICADAALSRLDEELAQSYGAAMAALPPDDAPVLRDSQRAWLKALRADCTADAPDAVACLRSAYQRRLAELAGDPYVVGPYAFTVIRRIWTEESVEACDGKSLKRAISYPQFLAPLSAAQAAWNRETAATVDREVKDWLDGDLGCNPDFAYAVIAAGAMEGFLATTAQATWLGNAHYESVSSSDNRLLATGRSLDAADLFDPAQPWRQALAETVARKLQTDARWPFEASAIVDQVGSSDAWQISADRLTVTIDFYQMSGGWTGIGRAEIPWREFKPWLRSDLPIALKLD